MEALLKRKKIFVITLKKGNMGNRLFLFSNVLAFAIENNFEVYNPTFYDFADCFKGTQNDFFCRYPHQETRLFRRSFFLSEYFHEVTMKIADFARRFPQNPFWKTFEFQSGSEIYDLDGPDFHEVIRGKKVVFIEGWPLMSRTSMAKHHSRILDYFKPLSGYSGAIEEPIKKLRQDNEIVVGVAIRHGHYRWWRGGKYFFDTDRYADVMRRTAELFPGKKTGFFICSDEEQDERKFEGLNILFRKGHDLENRYALSLCDYLISPPSTYAGWAAFYGKVPYYVMTDPDAPLDLWFFKQAFNLNF